MFIDIDYNKRKRGYKIYLAQPNKKIITNLSEAYEPTYSFKLGNINEVNFRIPYYIEKEDIREKNENVDLIREKMYLRVDYNGSKEWLIIDAIEDNGEGENQYMTVTAFSNAFETSHKRITGLELDTVNPDEYFEAILNDTDWEIGTVDSTFQNMYRSFDLGDSTVLQAILEGGETFGAVLDFDGEQKKINLTSLQKESKYRGLKINYKNFLQSVNRKRTVDKMVTRLYVYGADGLTITNANPTGMPYLEDFSYFMHPFQRDENKNVIQHSHYMSDELAHAILDLNELTEEYGPQIKDLQDEIDDSTFDLIQEETNLSNLRFQLSTAKGLLDIAKATGDSSLIQQRQGEVEEAQQQVNTKEELVSLIQDEIENLDRQIRNLQESISVTSFTKELRDELNVYIIEDEFRDERYIDEEELYDDSVAKFNEFKRPSVVIDASIDNVIDSLEEEYYNDKIVLGDQARITDEDMNIDVKSVITELIFELDDNSCNMVIANEESDVDGYDKILSILYSTQSATSRLEANKHKWNSVTELRTEVDQLRDGEIDAVRNRIRAGVNESVQIDDRGVVLSNPDYPDEMVIMQAGVIALTKDGGETWSTSVTPDGVVADTLIGRLVASNNLLITNDSGTFRVDSDGMEVDMDSIKIMSGSGETPQNMIDSWNQVIITMDEFGDDNLLNPYEKNQISRQWESIVATHSSMVTTMQDAYGPQTEENPYPVEYERYITAYENLNTFLNVTNQSDGHPILDPNTRNQTTPVNGETYTEVISEYQKHKDLFQTKIPLDFAQSSIDVAMEGISLNYVRNGEIATQLNLNEQGVRIDGKLLDVNGQTTFRDSVTMDAGVIKSKDDAIRIDLNAGTINLGRPLTINAVPVATQDDLDAIELQEGKSAYEIALQKGFEGTESQWLDSLQGQQGPQGEKGVKGEAGDDGRTPYIHYAWANNDTGTSGFSLTQSTNKTHIGIYSDFTENSSTDPSKYSWTLVKGPKGDQGLRGLQGPEGDEGIQGPKGEDGLHSYTHIAYANSEDGAQDFSLGDSDREYIGMYVDNSPNSSSNPNMYNWTLVKGSDGSQGIQGPKGDNGETPYFHTAWANNSVGTSGFSTTNSTDKLYIGTYTDFIQADSTDPSDYNWTRIKGDKGDKGEEGNGIESITEYYRISTSNTGISSGGSGWSTTPMSPTATNKYLWNYERIIYTDGSVLEFDARVIGVYGDQGEAGNTGRSIDKIEEFYLTSSNNSGITHSSSGWSSSIVAPTPSSKYIWNYERITYKNPSGTENKSPRIIGVYGDQGLKGDKGEDGKGIVSTTVRYQNHTNGTTAPTGTWVTSIPTPVQGRYLWTRTVTEYTDSSSVTTYSVSYYATDGQKGDTGSTGATGTGVSSTEVRYQISTSGTSVPTGTWSSSLPSPIKGRFLWTRTIISYTNGTSSTAYSTSYYATDGQKGDKGDKGDQGPQGIQGPAGANGQSQWTHIRYSANSNGSSMTTTPQSTTKYIGIAVTSSSSAPSASGFTWSKYIGEDGSQGPQGIQGPKGTDGQTTYTWVRYADNENGGGMSNFPDGKRYIGLAFNKTTPTESNTASHYNWTPLYDNVKVGGRNLVKDTTDEWEQVRHTGSHFNVYRVLNFKDDLGLEIGDEFTLSVIAESLSDTYDLRFRPEFYTSTSVRTNPLGIGEAFSEPTLCIGTMTVPENYENLRILFNGEPSNAGVAFDYQVKKLKIEKGNVATDWTEAPEDTDEKINDKADQETVDEVLEDISDLESISATKEELGEILSAFNEYKEALEQAEKDVDNAKDDIADLIGRVPLLETNFGEFTNDWNFLTTRVRTGDEGILIQELGGSTGIRISTDRIDFLDGSGEPVAYITGQQMRINRGIFVDSAQIGEHKIETITGGHTIWTWIN